MKDYVIDVVVRPDPTGEEKAYTCTSIRALTELDARRQILERAWGRHFLVTSISNVRIRGGKLY